MSARGRESSGLAWLLALLPSSVVVAEALLFSSFVLRARVALGAWPRSSSPSPNQLGFDLHRTLVWVGFALAVFMPFASLSASQLAIRLGMPRHHAASITVVFLALYLGGVALCFGDPGGFCRWFLS